MSDSLVRGRTTPVELAGIAAAAAILALELCFLVLSLGIGLARELSSALSDEQTCPNDMATALTRDRELACVPANTRLPDGWLLMSLGN